MSAVILGLRKFEHILRCKHFIIRTDSMSVVSLKRMPDPRGIFVRWQSFLDGFDYSFQHRPGKKSQNADSLSRMPGLEAEGPENQDPYGVDQDLIDEIYSVSVVERCEISDNAYRMYLQEDKVLQEAIKWVDQLVMTVAMWFCNVYSMILMGVWSGTNVKMSTSVNRKILKERLKMVNAFH